MQDLFVALNHNAYQDIISEIESHVTAMIENRHHHDLWPWHDQVLDEYEESVYGPRRHVYYSSTLMMIHVLRSLRKLGAGQELVLNPNVPRT